MVSVTILDSEALKSLFRLISERIYLMFKKNIDTSDRKAMINFLAHHFRYHTLNSWNRSTSYANNVKIYNLDVSEDVKEKMYQLLSCECEELNWIIDNIINNFYMQTGYTAGFNGRSSGYIVLYECNDEDHVFIGRSIDMYEDFENDWADDELRERVELVTKFDELCDDIISAVTDFCETHHMIEDVVTVTKPITRFVENT